MAQRQTAAQAPDRGWKPLPQAPRTVGAGGGAAPPPPPGAPPRGGPLPPGLGLARRAGGLHPAPTVRGACGSGFQPRLPG
jgi:hypothetical protein